MNYQNMTLEDIITYIKNELNKYEHCFNIETIFPFYLHATRIDINQIYILEQYKYIPFGLSKYILQNGRKIDINKSLYSF